MTWRLCIFVVIGICSQAAAQELTRSDLFSQQPGRYQIINSPHNVRDTFLLDTATGRVWQLIRYTDIVSEPTAWSEMPRVDQDKSFFATVTKFGWKLKETTEVSKPTAPKGPPQAPIRLGPTQ